MPQVVVGRQDMGALPERWQPDEVEALRRMYRAPMPGERERRHATWLLAQGWKAAAVAHAGTGRPHHWSMGQGFCGRRCQGRWFLNRLGFPRAGRGATGRIDSTWATAPWTVCPTPVTRPSSKTPTTGNGYPYSALCWARIEVIDRPTSTLC